MSTNFSKHFNNSSNNITDLRLEDKNKMLHEQFFTPMKVASYMSSMFSSCEKEDISFLDPGAGVGNLSTC